MHSGYCTLKPRKAYEKNRARSSLFKALGLYNKSSSNDKPKKNYNN
jgi:hypothetical protein